MTSGRTIGIDTVDHIGIRVSDVPRALEFYSMLGFETLQKVEFDAVIIIKNPKGVEINLITNANNPNDGNNILMDVPDKFAGITHLALRVDSMRDTIDILKENNVTITQGPVMFGRDGHVSVFVRDPDRNVLELRGRQEDLSEIDGLTHYEPQN